MATGTRLCQAHDLSFMPEAGMAQRFVAALGALTTNLPAAFRTAVFGPIASHMKSASLAVFAAAKASGSGGIQGWLLHLHGPVVYVAVGALLFLEVGIVVGFFIPGEVATILGGVIASQHHANLPTMIVVVALCASLGNLSGYGVGVLIGPWLLERKIFKDNAGIIRTRALIARRGGPAIFVGRWVVFVRAVLPGVAGISRMRLGKFIVFSLLGGIVWGSMWVLIGYAAGNSYAKVEKAAGSWSLVILGVVIVALGVFIAFRKRKEHRENRALLAEHGLGGDVPASE
jgi:LPXTG-motif cell wall-anchored protein